MRQRQTVIFGILSVLTLFATQAWAAGPTDTLRPAADEVTRILEDPALKSQPKEREARVRAVVSDLFDYPEIAVRVLGRHWRSLGQTERTEFTQLFREFLEHTYLPKISLYQGERVRFVGELVDGEFATVKALVSTRQGKEVPVSYRLGQHDGRWRVFDIAVEGISFVNNYRSQFDQVISRSSYQKLTERLRQKLTAPPDQTPTGISPFQQRSR